jgi:hypothetical protein
MNIYMHPEAAAQTTADAIGTKVLKPMALHDAITTALETYEFPANGQGFVSLPEESWSCVMPGVARRTANPEDYKSGLHRGKVGQFLDRSKVEPPPLDGVAAIVYTAEAFLADPQTSEEEKAAFVEAGFTHCWVTTLAFAGPKPPVTAWRFVVNLAGGNAAYAEMTKGELVEMAQAIEAYEAEWCVVA